MRWINPGPRQWPATSLAIAVLTLVVSPWVSAGIGLAAFSPAVAAPSAETHAEESQCIVYPDMWVHPTRILLGETVDVTMTTNVICAGMRFPLHIVLVLDGSGSMDGAPSRQMKQAAVDLVVTLELDKHPETKVGIVEFNSRTRTLSMLSSGERSAIRAIDRVVADRGTRIDAGILEGIQVMRAGRGDEKDITEVMVVMSGGVNDVGCAPVQQAARQGRGQGILMTSVCVGPDCNEQCMRLVSSSPRYYFPVENLDALSGVFEQIRDRFISVVTKGLSVEDSLSPLVRYVPGSAVPEPSQPVGPENRLQWDDVYIPTGGVTYTFELRPLAAGYLAPIEDARGHLTDNLGRTKEWAFNVPWITVLAPGVLPTPPTTPTITPSPTVTPTPRTLTIYLPYQLRKYSDS